MQSGGEEQNTLSAMSNESENTPQVPLQLANEGLVKDWLAKIACAKKKWEPDFKRMRDNMRFASGMQWAEQTQIEDERYTINLTARLINQMVASLYAKNPEGVALPRKKMYYQMWDGDMESRVSAIQQAEMMVETGVPLPPELAAFMADLDEGDKMKEQIERICETLTLASQYQIDTQHIDFKEQMKSSIRRVGTTTAAYVEVSFCRDGEDYKEVSSVNQGSTQEDRILRLKELMREVAEEGEGQNSPKFAQLHALMTGLNAPSQQMGTVLNERIEFDFPLSTNVIPDPACRQLKGFVGAGWIAIRYRMSVQDVNAIFDVDVKTDITVTQEQSNYPQPPLPPEPDGTKGEKMCDLYKVYNYKDKTRFFIVDGWKDFVVEPEGLETNLTGFWPIFALTFDDVESEPNAERMTIFPPCLVDAIKHPQKEWNRTRQALREQRNANAPKYIVRKGQMTDDDKRRIFNALPNEVVEVEGCPPDQKLEEFLVRFATVPIDPALYDTAPLEKDILMASGTQQANIGPAQANVTATVGSIAEQSRQTESSSNVDDLDSFLSKIYQAMGEMMLQNFSLSTIQRIVGPGAAWPNSPDSRAELSNELLLTIKAASSGRPNKALEVQNAQQLVPLIQNAGGNPVGIVEYVSKVLDANLDEKKFFPIQSPQPSAGASSQGNASSVTPAGQMNKGNSPSEPAPAPNEAPPSN